MKNLNQYISLSSEKISSIDDYISMLNERISSIYDYISMLNERISSIDDYITEKLVLSRNNKFIDKQYLPKTTEELKEIVAKLVDEQSMEDIINLNYIDTSYITDMHSIFNGFEGIIKIDISDWDVSKVKNMDSMFKGCVNLEKIVGIEDFDVYNVENMQDMFRGCEVFNQDISKWNVSNVYNKSNMFFYCEIEEKYKPKFV